MRIKIKFSNGEKDIEISPKKKHRNFFLDKIEELKKVTDSGKDEIKSTREFIDFQDKLAMECSNMTQELYDDLDLEEQAKITKALRGIIFPHAGGDPANFF